jgi:hypothetical protein
MDQNTNLAPYSGVDFAKDVTKSIAVSAAYQAVGIVVAIGTLAAAGYVMQKIEDRKSKKTSTN